SSTPPAGAYTSTSPAPTSAPPTCQPATSTSCPRADTSSSRPHRSAESPTGTPRPSKATANWTGTAPPDSWNRLGTPDDRGAASPQSLSPRSLAGSQLSERAIGTPACTGPPSRALEADQAAAARQAG